MIRRHIRVDCVDCCGLEEHGTIDFQNEETLGGVDPKAGLITLYF